MKLRLKIKRAYYRTKGYFPATIGDRRYRLAVGNARFWDTVERDEWEPDTFTVLDRCLRPDSVYLDIGAWIGPTVLFAAQRCQTVYCLEPDPVAYERLLGNLRMNGVDNVLPFHGALGAGNGRIQIVNEENFGNSETRVQAGPGGGVTVLAMDIFSLIDLWGIEKIDLLKMDIEGAEFDLMPSLIALLPRIKPTIHLSLHAPLLPPHRRREKLAAIVQLAGHYAFCYDKRLNPISPKEILEERFTDKFNTVVLTDEAL